MTPTRQDNTGGSPERWCLALRGIQADFGPDPADTVRLYMLPDLRANSVLTNPPINDSDLFLKRDAVRLPSLSAANGERAGVRCRNDGAPKGNANFAWVQHFIHDPAPH